METPRSGVRDEASGMKYSILAMLEVVTWHQAWGSRLGCEFGFPPTVVLMSEDSKNFAFGETKFFRYCGGVAIHCTGYIVIMS